MEAHGKPKGLHKYWGIEITIPKPLATDKTPSTSETPTPNLLRSNSNSCLLD